MRTEKWAGDSIQFPIIRHQRKGGLMKEVQFLLALSWKKMVEICDNANVFRGSIANIQISFTATE